MYNQGLGGLKLLPPPPFKYVRRNIFAKLPLLDCFVLFCFVAISFLHPVRCTLFSIFLVLVQVVYYKEGEFSNVARGGRTINTPV